MAPVSCPSCATESPESARFCMGCGAALPRGCPSCGTVNPVEARFCMNCGFALAAEGAPEPAPPPAAPAPAPAAAPHPEERRVVTVLFADLSGYTAIAETMDPEAVKGLVDGSLKRLGQEVERYGGTVDKYIGDNVMALFGAPVAHEDDPERAVRAGLAMQTAMGEINDGLESSHGVRFNLRVGVNSGEVVAGAVGDGYTVIGDTVNVASRLQARAPAGGIVVGGATLRGVPGLGATSLGDVEVRGKREVVDAYLLETRSR
jgi:adenylate cyclase